MYFENYFVERPKTTPNKEYMQSFQLGLRHIFALQKRHIFLKRSSKYRPKRKSPGPLADGRGYAILNVVRKKYNV